MKTFNNSNPYAMANHSRFRFLGLSQHVGSMRRSPTFLYNLLMPSTLSLAIRPFPGVFSPYLYLSHLFHLRIVSISTIHLQACSTDFRLERMKCNIRWMDVPSNVPSTCVSVCMTGTYALTITACPMVIKTSLVISEFRESVCLQPEDHTLNGEGKFARISNSSYALHVFHLFQKNEAVE